jgi:DMSO/TMAO reductase YedYZ molybdopterin-dependent catalytic subunit
MPLSAIMPPVSPTGDCRSTEWSPGPASLSLSDLWSLPVHHQITEVACEEGWSYIAEWIGTLLVDVLNTTGLLRQARYIVYFSIDRDWWESIDMADAFHPQTFLTWGMNDGDLPVSFGGPLRLRVPAN